MDLDRGEVEAAGWGGAENEGGSGGWQQVELLLEEGGTRGAGLLGWSGMQNEEVVGSAGWGGWIGSGIPRKGGDQVELVAAERRMDGTSPLETRVAHYL